MSQEAAKPASGGGKSKNRVAVAKDNLGARIMLDGQPAVGLFVLFAPVPAKVGDAPAGAAGNAQTAKGDAQGALVYTLCFVDGQGYPQTVAAGSNPWREISDQLDALAKLRSSAVKKGASKPIFAPKGCKNPHGFKLTEGASYRLCLVSHPNPELGQAMLSYLNGGKAAPRFVFPKREEVTFEAKVQTDDDDGGKVAHIDLPSDPKNFWPAGHDRYGGWVLYQDMPYWHLSDVQTAVSTLAGDLAELRYPTGEDGRVPYPSASSKEHSGRFGTTLMACVHGFQRDAAAGNALARAKVGAVPAGSKVTDSWAYLLASAAKPDPPKPAAPVASADSVLTSAVTPPVGDEDDGPDPELKVESNVAKLPSEETIGVGVVTKVVGEAIATWRKSSYRKNGAILVQTPIDPGFWARPELATSLLLWDIMAKALGCAYGIKLTHTFRELTVPAGVGRVECSNHKLGLSVDLLSKKFRETSSSWPVHYEANWTPSESGVAKAESERIRKAEAKVKQAEQKRDKAKAYLDGLDAKQAAGKPPPTGARSAGESVLKQTEADVEAAKAELAAEKAADKTLDAAVDKAKSNYLLRWRIYGHSSMKVWNAPTVPTGDWTAIAPGELQALLAGEKSLGVSASGPWGVEAAMGKALRHCFPAPAEAAGKDAVEAIVSAGEKQARQVAETIYSLAGKEGNAGLIATFFRREIRPFDYNPFEADGGTSLAPISVESDGKIDQAAVYFGKASEIHSYLNLTRLGFECGMNRISAQRAVQTGTFKRPDEDPEYKPKLAPSNLVFDLVSDGKSRKASALAEMLTALARAIGDLGKLTDAEKPRVKLADGQEVTYELADFDRDFIDAWATIMGERKSPFAFEDLALVLGFSADQTAFEARGKSLAAVANKKFMLVSAGKQLSMDDDVGKALSFQDWSEELPRRQKRMGRNDVAIRMSSKKTSLEFSLILTPMFGTGSLDSKQLSQIIFPPCGQPAPLEWWHHDNKAMAGSWAAMAEAIGYSGIVVRADDVPPERVQNGQAQGGLGFDPKKVERNSTPTTVPPENGARTIPDGG